MIQRSENDDALVSALGIMNCIFVINALAGSGVAVVVSQHSAAKLPHGILTGDVDALISKQ